jgi:hypothetical protein
VESVKELNRCLLLHYSFNDPAVEPTVNLLHNETIVFNGLTSNVSHSTTGNKTLLTVSPKENYSYGSLRMNLPLSVLTTGVQYALSFKYRVISGSGYLTPSDWCDIGLSEATRKVTHIDDYFL